MRRPSLSSFAAAQYKVPLRARNRQAQRSLRTSMHIYVSAVLWALRRRAIHDPWLMSKLKKARMSNSRGLKQDMGAVFPWRRTWVVRPEPRAMASRTSM